MYKFISNAEEDTINFAFNLAPLLSKGNIIVLSGDLGSGKTKFTQGILKYYGLENEISSPTFTIVNEYTNNSVNIYHFDVYRLADSDEFYAIGGDEYLNNGICIIEWGEIIEDILPPDYIKICFSRGTDDESCRVLEISTIGKNSEEIIKNLQKI